MVGMLMLVWASAYAAVAGYTAVPEQIHLAFAGATPEGYPTGAFFSNFDSFSWTGRRRLYIGDGGLLAG